MCKDWRESLVVLQGELTHLCDDQDVDSSWGTEDVLRMIVMPGVVVKLEVFEEVQRCPLAFC